MQRPSPSSPAFFLYLPSYWLAGAELQRLLVVQSAWASLASLLVPTAIHLHFLPIFSTARLNTRRAFLLALTGVLLVATLNLNLLYATGRLEPTVWWFMLALGGFMGWAGRFEVARERTSARLKLAEVDARRLGAAAERERIARDLHDLLGQSLSLIAVKAELTKKLAPSDLERALRENDDVIRIAKKTLAEVRQAVTSYRAPTLEDELVNADLALRSVGGTLEVALEPVTLTDDQETALAFVLREGVTNVVRHAAASRCWVRLQVAAKGVIFTVEDNGRGGGAPVVRLQRGAVCRECARGSRGWAAPSSVLPVQARA